MKRIIFMCMVLSALFLSCKNEFETNQIEISYENTSLRNNFRKGLENSNSDLSRSINEDSENSVEYKFPEGITPAEFLLENNLISQNTAKYIQSVESIIIDKTLTIEDTVLQIEQIELDAKSVLKEDEYTAFLNFSEMSIASLDYYSNLESTDRGLFSWLKEKSNNICNAVVSGALGAVVGGILYASASAVVIWPGITVAGFVFGAVTVGASSAWAGFLSGDYILKFHRGF